MYCITAVLAALAAAPVVEAQVPAPQAVRPLVLERVVYDRWLHEGQQPTFVRFDSVRSAIHVSNSFSRFSDLRTMTLHDGNLTARFLVERNRPGSMTIERTSTIRYDRYEDERGREEARRRALRGAGAMQNLPETRFWEVPFVMPAAPLRTGTTWSDTLAYLADPGEGLWETLEGVWLNEVVGDTVVDGRSLPLVRSNAEVRYRSRELHADNALAVTFEIERDATGTITGRAAIDTASGVRAVGVDTTLLSGTAVLRTGDGGAFTSAVRYDRQRTWLLRDSTTWAAIEDSLRVVRGRQSTGMLSIPRTPLEERIRAGEAVVVDSLLARWREAANPNERSAIGALLLSWSPSAAARQSIEDRLRALRLETGDSARVIAEEIQSLSGRQRITQDRLARLLPYLDDPGRLWRLGGLPGYAYTELGGVMLRATPILEPDPERWACEPLACRTIVDLINTAAEPRLRDVALVGAFAREPSRWFDRLVERADSGSLIARNAVEVGQGVGARWAAAPKIPVPEPDASWQTWLQWLGGTVRWETSHAMALRLYSARTGRDPVQELRGRWPAAEDSARLVLGTVLRGMNALPAPTASELAAMFLSGSAADIRLARDQIGRRIRSEGGPLPEGLAVELLRPLLDSMAVQGDAPWPAVHEVVTGRTGRVISPFGLPDVREVPMFVLDEALPSEIIAALPQPFEAISTEAWEARPRRAGGALITFQPARYWDGFVTIDWSWTVFRRRGPDEAPSGYAGGGGLTLLRTPVGWRVVAVSAWIT